MARGSIWHRPAEADVSPEGADKVKHMTIFGNYPASSAQVVSTLGADGILRVYVEDTEVLHPRRDEVVVQIGAAPINPTDAGLLFGGIDMRNAKNFEERGRPTLIAPASKEAMARLALRVEKSLPCGTEGAGIVVAAGDSDSAQALLGRTVAITGVGTYAQYRTLSVADCLVLPEGVNPEEAASWFVNPMTALGFLETARMYGHKAIVHTAAASNLGRMFNRLCMKEGIALVNIVRSSEQKQLLELEGAQIVLDSSKDTFLPDLTEALADSGATIGFDAIGGGPMTGNILSCMEAAINRNSQTYDRYGSKTMKRMYVYGGLDGRAIELPNSSGKAWTVSGWLLYNFLAEIDSERQAELKAYVAANIRTVFASEYGRTLSLNGILDVTEVHGYLQRSTGLKYLVQPQTGPSV